MMLPLVAGLGLAALAAAIGRSSSSASAGSTVPAGGTVGAPGTGGGAPAPAPPGSPSASRWAPRPDLPLVDAYPWPTRSEVLAWAETLPADAPTERHAQVCALLDAGKLDAPNWVRVPVRGGLEVEVMGDVVSYGGIRLCASMRTAQAVADGWHALIPTAGICDAIWRAATVRVRPQTMQPNPGGAKAFMLYQADRLRAAVWAEVERLTVAGNPPTTWIAADLGKDYVLTPRLNAKPGQCAIYGWHTGRTGDDDRVIQSGKTGASLIHPLDFFDYSQTIRLVRRTAWLRGEPVDLAGLYQSAPELVAWRGLNEGPIPARHPAVPFRGGTLT